MCVWVLGAFAVFRAPDVPPTCRPRYAHVDRSQRRSSFCGYGCFSALSRSRLSLSPMTMRVGLAISHDSRLNMGKSCKL